MHVLRKNPMKPLRVIDSIRGALKQIALAGLAMVVTTTAQAGVIVYEGFTYAGQADNAPLGAAFNGGTGLSGNWQGAGKYRSTGLTFSDLAVAGGCAQNGNSDIYYRPLNVSKTGTIWGSFLFKSVGVVDNSDTLLSYIVSKQAGGTDYNANTSFGVTPKRYQGTNGDIRLGGNTPNPTALSNSGGTAVTQGTTYLVLFKVENLIASGAATATSQTITSWILSAAQYDNFKSGGLTETELNAASQGGAATNVMQRTTLTATQKASFSVNDFLTVQSNNTGDFMNDEFRFSDTSLAEVAPPEPPAANIVSFGPGATIGPVTASAAAISWTVPFGTNVTTLAPTYTSSAGATCPKISGSTQDFTNPVHYIVTSSDSLFTTDYTVTVTVAPASSAKAILSCDFGVLGPATIAGTNITLFVSPSQAVTNLAPTFTLSPLATLSPVSGTVRDFTTPQTYTVTAQNGTTQAYTVAVQSYATWSNTASFFILTTPDGASIPTGVAETNFPVLLRLNSGNFNFTQAQSDGRDIRFTTLSGIPLAYQIEQWDAVAGTAAVWIKIPSISANASQEIKMYWGKTGVATESSGPNVFNAANGYVSVMHLNGNVQDSTGLTSPVNAGASSSTAMIGSTAMNLGTGDITAANITHFPSGTNPTSSGGVWIRARQITSGWAMPLAWGNKNAYGWNTWNMQIGFWGSSTVLPAPIYCRGPATVAGSTALVAQQWYHVAYTNSNGTGKLYINGVLDGTASGGAISLDNPQAMALSAAGGDIDVDEARVSSVARSANWIKMEYENQKSQQTLVGSLVQAGSTFAVTPASATLLEGTSTTLSAQAGGAQKVYWIEKRNGVDTLLATDQFTLPVTAGRVTGTQNYIIQFKAIYAASVQTLDVPITITEDLPDPVFTLTGPSTWDGRQTITVTPTISNLATLQAKSLANLTYTWSVGGVAAAKTITTGTPTVPGVMTLTRSQGSGPMTITLVLNNGGSLVAVTKTITVTEPATDPYVQRTPGATEIPVTGQFYARDDSGMGKLYYNGSQSGTPDTVFLKVYTTDAGDVLYATHRQSLVAGKYTFTAPLAPGRVTYKVVYGTTTSGNDTVLNTVTNLVCGDAYLFEGQSNAVATDSLPADATTDPWIRTYGSSGGGWGNAVRNGTQWTVGYFAFDLALSLTTTYNMPICIINGAVGGTRVDQHQANPADHTAAGSSYSIYANLLNRVLGAKLTHGIRGVFWHQGENNSGSAAPTGDYDYKSYQQYFVEMTAAWKQDYPNLGRYIIFQVMPKPCSMGPKGDQLRDVQRTLPLLYSKMDILNTLGVPGYIGCHFTAAGYQNVADRTLPLAKQRYYGFVRAAPVTAPVLQRAYFTSAARTAIALVFDQPMSWSSFSMPNYYVDKVGGKVTSGSVAGNVVTLQLNSAAATTATLDYLQDNIWNFNEASSSLLYGANALPALTFADVAIEPASQTITFGALPTKTFGNAPFALTATASSGLAVSYLSSDPLVASISGNTVTLLKAGSTTITASQAGNASFSAATPVAQLLTVNNAATTTTLSTSGTPSTFGSTVTLTATVAPSMSGGTVQFYDNAVALGSPVALSGGQAQFATSSLAAATHSITATYSGTTNYGGSTASALTQTVNPVSYTSWAADPAQGLTAGVNDGLLDDPDHDGIANLMEFVLAGAPMVSSQVILPALTKSAGAWVFEYERSDISMAPATTQVVEYGSDLSGWTSVTIPATTGGIVTITLGSPSDHVVVTLPSQGNQTFVRLKVSQ